MIILYAILFILIFLISFYNLLYLYEPTIKFEVTDKFQTIKDYSSKVTDKFQTIKDYSSNLNNILPYDDEETNDFDNICDKILSELDIENVFYKNFYNLKRDILNEVESIAYFDNISFGIRLHDSLENFDELYKEKKVEIENRIKLVFAKFYLQKKYIEIRVYKKLQGEELNENNEDIKGVSKLVLKEDEKSISDERIFKEEINLISNEIDILATYIESYNSKYDEKNLKEEDKYVDDEKNKITEEKEILATFIEAFNSIFIEENSIDQDNYDKYVEYKNSKITKEKDIVSNEKSCKLVNDGKNKITKEKKIVFINKKEDKLTLEKGGKITTNLDDNSINDLINFTVKLGDSVKEIQNIFISLQKNKIKSKESNKLNKLKKDKKYVSATEKELEPIVEEFVQCMHAKASDVIVNKLLDNFIDLIKKNDEIISLSKKELKNALDNAKSCIYNILKEYKYFLYECVDQKFTYLVNNVINNKVFEMSLDDRANILDVTFKIANTIVEDLDKYINEFDKKLGKILSN